MKSVMGEMGKIQKGHGLLMEFEMRGTGNSSALIYVLNEKREAGIFHIKSNYVSKRCQIELQVTCLTPFS